jgi:hypothetical protein
MAQSRWVVAGRRIPPPPYHRWPSGPHGVGGILVSSDGSAPCRSFQVAFHRSDGSLDGGDGFGLASGGDSSIVGCGPSLVRQRQ